MLAYDCSMPSTSQAVRSARSRGRAPAPPAAAPPGRARPRAERPLTMKQIGELVGVSQSTVSRVLSGAASSVPVAPATRARILQVAAERLLRLAQPPTAILASTDVAAIGSLKAAARCGRRVPDQLSVVGFDDIPLAEFAVPSLTTVHQPIERIAREAVQHLLPLIAEPEQPRQRRRDSLEPSLVVRESTAPP